MKADRDTVKVALGINQPTRPFFDSQAQKTPFDYAAETVARWRRRTSGTQPLVLLKSTRPDRTGWRVVAWFTDEERADAAFEVYRQRCEGGSVLLFQEGLKEPRRAVGLEE